MVQVDVICAVRGLGNLNQYILPKSALIRGRFCLVKFFFQCLLKVDDIIVSFYFNLIWMLYWMIFHLLTGLTGYSPNKPRLISE